MAVFTSRLCGALSLLCQVIGSPDHDEIQSKVETITAAQSYLTADGRRLSANSQTCPQIKASGTLGSLRIGYELVDVSSVSVDIQNLVKDSLMQKATAYWGATLQVRRTSEPLRAPRRCTSTWSCGGICGSMVAPTCGEDVTIPSNYLDSLEVCTDCAGTCTTHAQGAGGENEDMHVFVTIKEKSGCGTGGASGSLASASWCIKDQCDRPIFATVNFCPQELSLDAADLDMQVSTAVHELGHALGFSSSLFKYFRNTDGTPKIARESDDQDGFPTGVTWYCATGYQISYPATGNGQGNLEHVDLSPDNIVKVFSERGFDNCECPVGKSTMGSGCVVRSSQQTPTCVMRMVLPTVVSEARDFFDCPSLPGAELENQPTSDCSIFGSHWEQRVFNGEVMASTTSSQVPSYLSRVTLALFQDSGWYEVDFSMADTPTVGVHWGYKQGCAFAENKCITSGTPVNSNIFCTDTQNDVCSLDRTGARACSLNTYQSVPSQFDYGINNQLGSVSVMDYCPSYVSLLSNRVCTDTSSITLPYSNYNFMLEYLGPQSRCFSSTFRAPNNGQSAPDDQFTQSRPTCYQVECASDNLSYKLKIADATLSGYGHSTGPPIELGTCTTAGMTLSGTGSQKGSVTCASPAEICLVPAIHTQGAPTTTITAAAATTTVAATTTSAVATTAQASTTEAPTTTAAATTIGATTSTAAATTTGAPTSIAAATTTADSTTVAATTTHSGISSTGGATTSAGGADTSSAATTTTTPTQTQIDTTTSIATTTVPSAGGTITSQFTMSVSDVDAFLADAAAINAVKTGVASWLGVFEDWVAIVTSAAAARRLASEASIMQEARRLAGSVKVVYTVTVPAGSTTSVNAVASVAHSATTAQITSAVSPKVAAVNANYGVQVTSKAAVSTNGSPYDPGADESITSGVGGVLVPPIVTALLMIFCLVQH